MLYWDTLHSQHNVEFLLTNCLNQDCVENFFSMQKVPREIIQILQNFGQHIVRKLLKRVCVTCKNRIYADLALENPSHKFIAAKSYKCLLAPSSLLLGTVQLLEFKNREVIAATRTKFFQDYFMHASFTQGCCKCSCHTI